MELQVEPRNHAALSLKFQMTSKYWQAIQNQQETFLYGLLATNQDSSIYRAFSETNPLSEKFILSIILEMMVDLPPLGEECDCGRCLLTQTL